MKNYRIILSYAGAVDFEVKATGEDEALRKAQQLCSEMPDQKFYNALDVQEYDSSVEEIQPLLMEKYGRYTPDQE